MTEEEKELILGYLDDRLSASQFDSLQTLLRENKDARSFLLDLGTIDTKLDDFSLSVDQETSTPQTIPFSWPEYAWAVVACLLVLFCALQGTSFFQNLKSPRFNPAKMQPGRVIYPLPKGLSLLLVP